MNRNVLISLSFFVTGVFFSQTNMDFSWPIDTPYVISGNYGELRPNHFHMGWDFSTRGKINLPIYAIADGYVSRIKVSSAGYGRALYISYPGNLLGVVAHLTSYAPKISDLVKAEQFSKKKYEIEMFPERDEVRVKKGELIGYSGNSGNSSGPHLHFEIRDQQSEIPQNLTPFYSFGDSVKPVIEQVAFYDLADTCNPVVKNIFKIRTSKKDSQFIQKDSIVLDHSITGFAFSGFDRFSYRGNPNVIYSAELFLDDRKIFSYAFDGISFDDQRYVNEFSEVFNKTKYQKCFLPTIYPAGLYKNCLNKGRIVLADTNFHLLKLMVSDEHNNSRTVQLYFKCRRLNNYARQPAKGDLFVDCTRDFISVKNNIKIYVTANTLYYSTTLKTENSLSTDRSLLIMPARANFAKAVKISFSVPTKLSRHRSRLVLKNNAIVYCPSVNGDSLTYAVYSFGRFQIDIDTMAPQVRTQLSPNKIKRLKTIEFFSFVIRDNLSGIGKYNMYLNENWVVAEYDAKSNKLTYFFDRDTPAGNLNFRIKVEDKVGNVSVFKYSLKRKSLR